MFCIECGKKLPDEAKFCMYCGTPIHMKLLSEATEGKPIMPGTADMAAPMNPYGTEGTTTEPLRFEVWGNPVHFHNAVVQNIQYRRAFHKNAYQQKSRILSYYLEKVAWFNDVYEFAIPQSLEYIENAVDLAVKVLLDNGIYDYSRDSFVKEFKIDELYLADIALIGKKYDEIEEAWNSIKQTRNIQRNSRSRWQGGGFGLGGAIKGAITADLLNAGTGMFRGIGDAILDSKDSAKINNMKRDAFENFHFKEIIADAVYYANIRIGHFLCCTLAENKLLPESVPIVDAPALRLRIENVRAQLKGGAMSKDQAVQKMTEWIAENPFAFDYYGFLYEIMGNADHEVVSLCDFLGFGEEYRAYKNQYATDLLRQLKSDGIGGEENLDARLLQIEEISKNYDLPELEQKELADIKYAVAKEKALEDGINSQVDENAVCEAQVKDVLGQGKAEMVWEMLNPENGYVEWELTRYYEKLTQPFIDRKDFARIEKKLAYVYEQAEAGNLYAEYLVNDIKRNCYSKSGDNRRVIRIDERLLELAEKGQISASASVGFYYYHGYGYFKQDYGRAFEMLEYAAEKNHPTGMAWLGSMYREGIGVKADRNQAYKWLKLAAYYGQPYAVKELKKL